MVRKNTKKIVGRKRNRKKRWIVGSILLFFVLWGSSSYYKQTIRSQEVRAVREFSESSPGFEHLDDTTIQTKFKNKDDFVVMMYRVSNNPSLNVLEQFFEKGMSSKELEEPVFIYQPIYDFEKVSKELDLKNANNIISIKSGKVDMVYGFDKVTDGTKEIEDALFTLLNPKIEPKTPVQTKKVNQEDELEFSGEENKVDTQEITFD